MKKIFKIILVILAVLFLLFAGLVAAGFSRRFEKDKTDVAIARINSTKITLDDVMGKYLPQKPDQKQNDATIEGVDTNKNYIRDDVELAIFEKYPNSAKMRAAELQYAQALQLELTQVFNSESFISALKKEDSAYFCISKIAEDKEKEVDSLIANNNLRRNKIDENIKKYMTTYTLPKSDCDLDLSSLPD